MASEELPNIVWRWWRPPRVKGSKNKRPKGVGPVMESLAKECCQSVLDQELEGIARVSPVGEDIKEETLTSLSLTKMAEEMKENPDIVSSQKIQTSFTSTHTCLKIVLMIISMLSYTRSHHHSQFQKMFAIYLKF